MPDKSEFINTKKAADLLGQEVQHVRRLLREHKLEGQKIGRDWIVQRESVIRRLAEKENLRLKLPGKRT